MNGLDNGIGCSARFDNMAQNMNNYPNPFEAMNACMEMNANFNMNGSPNATPPFSERFATMASLVSGLPLTAPALNSPIVQLFGTSGSVNSFIWQFQPAPNGGFFIFSATTQGVMMPMGRSMDSGAPIVPALLDASDFQVWDPIQYNPTGDPNTATYFFVNRATGLYLDITADRITPGTQLIQFPRNPQSFFNQIFLVSIYNS